MSEVPEDEVRDLERSADEMEEGLGRLQGNIDAAQEQADQHRERVEPSAIDAEESSAAEPSGDGDGDAPVYEASEVRPGGESDGEDDDARDEGAPVHEAEQVEPEASADEDDGAGDDEGFVA